MEPIFYRKMFLSWNDFISHITYTDDELIGLFQVRNAAYPSYLFEIHSAKLELPKIISNYLIIDMEKEKEPLYSDGFYQIYDFVFIFKKKDSHAPDNTF